MCADALESEFASKGTSIFYDAKGRINKWQVAVYIFKTQKLRTINGRIFKNSQKVEYTNQIRRWLSENFMSTATTGFTYDIIYFIKFLDPDPQNIPTFCTDNEERVISIVCRLQAKGVKLSPNILRQQTGWMSDECQGILQKMTENGKLELVPETIEGKTHNYYKVAVP